MTENERIARFWEWWCEQSAEIAQAIETGKAADLGPEISARVDALHPDLQSELTPGRAAKHALVVTSGGTPELRPLTERWVRAAPPADVTWEYHPARVADRSALRTELRFGPHTLQLSQSQVGIEPVAQTPPDALPLEALAETVESLAERNDEGDWVLLEGELDDGARARA